MMLGPMKISTIDAIKPEANPQTAPEVLKRFQKIENRITGRFADAATAKASATRNATFAFGPSMIAIGNGDRPNDESRDTRDLHFLTRRALGAVVNDVGPEVVRKRCRSADRQSCDHRQDRRERNRRDEREEHVAAERCASSGALMLVPPFLAMKSRPTMVAAPKPRNVVMM